jgi:cupin superfamily acireductone dioxygenase involved in methionine salvage
MDKKIKKGKSRLKEGIRKVRIAFRRAWKQLYKAFTRRKQEKRDFIREINRKIDEISKKTAKERERRDLTQIKLIKALGNDSSKLLFDYGIVDFLHASKNEIIKIADGWTSELIIKTPKVEKFYVKADKQSLLPIHNHKQSEYIRIISGNCKVRLINEDNSVEYIYLKDHDTLKISPYVHHEFYSISDLELIVTFEPPITINE